MGRKIILLADPGIDGAVALTLALHDPELEVLAICATAGNVSGEQATRNVQVIIEQLDPPRWPRIGTAQPEGYDGDARVLHGPDGLGGNDFPCAQLHHPHASDRLIIDIVRQNPREVSLVVLGPCTTVARALDRDPEWLRFLDRLIIVGGCRHDAGDASAVADFHFWCDPVAAQQVLKCGASITLLPLDVTRKLILSPAEIRQISSQTRLGKFVGRILPSALAPTAGLFGVEGVYLSDVLGVLALSRPESITTKPVIVDVETRGDLTRGMSVFDTRWGTKSRPNVELATGVEVSQARDYVQGILNRHE